jgi:hypothetical protein
MPQYPVLLKKNFFCSIEGWTQVLTHARWALYHLSPVPSPFLFVHLLFEIGTANFAQQGSNHNTPASIFQVAEVSGVCHHHMWTFLEFFKQQGDSYMTLCSYSSGNIFYTPIKVQLELTSSSYVIHHLPPVCAHLWTWILPFELLLTNKGHTYLKVLNNSTCKSNLKLNSIHC